MTAKYPPAPLDTGLDGPGRPTEVLDLRWVLAFFWRRAWIMAGVFLVVLAAAVGIYMSTPKVFVAASTVLIDRSKFNVVQGLETTSDPVLDSAAVDTEAQVLQSRD
ncbi:MAG: hypothetical protein JWM33_1321, partial [Caulobacteraceae bacterium]|nr:hypothetical protein [Caulobacteraceae bacterium]